MTLSPTHSRPAECGSGQAIQARPDHPNSGLSFQRSSTQSAAGGTGSNRLICYEVQQQVASVSPVPDPLATVVDTLSRPW